MRPRVFVSSVMEGFGEHRQAAKRGILSAGAEPVLAEDFPSLPVSSRNACLDGVASCDIYVAVLGSRGGWSTPAGKLVVEEEYEEAVRRRMRILVFIHRCARDSDCERLVTRMSDYVDGLFRHPYDSVMELESDVRRSLMPLIEHLKNPEVELNMITDTLRNPHRFSNETGLRFVLAPARTDELVDHLTLESKEFKRFLLEIGHASEVELFSYEHSKTVDVGVNEIVLRQADDAYRRQGSEQVRLEVTTLGLIVIDVNVTGRQSAEDRENLYGSMVLLEGDIASGLTRCFAFANAFYGGRDPYQRFDRMHYNTALSGIGMRTLRAERPRGGSLSVGSHGEAPVNAFDAPRMITRADLRAPGKEIESAVALFRRRLR